MEKLFSKKIQSEIFRLGIYQVAGGAIGVLLVFGGIFGTRSPSGLIILVYLVMLAFFAYSIFCGVLCLNNMKNALKHSLTNQILQVFGFAIFGFAFKYAAGLYLTVGLNLTEGVNISFGTGFSKIDFNFNNEEERVELDFNLVAFGIIYWIEKLKRRIKTENELMQITSTSET